MFRKNKDRNDRRRILMYRILKGFTRFINRYSVRQFLIGAVIIAAAVIFTFEGFELIYKSSVITRQTALIQNEAVLISAEYSNYESLAEAERNSMNSRLSSYSALNQIRIRVVDMNYVVCMDTYAIDTGKTILNSRVFDIFRSHKNSSGYDKKTGNIEAAVPVYNSTGDFIAVLIADLDYTEIDGLFHDVNGQNNNIKLVIITVSFVALIVGIYFMNRPLKRVIEIVANVSAGHTDERIPIKGYTEIREIADDFNNIMDRANETDQSRAEFVSNVSHELKTPITSIKVLAESLNTQDDVPIEVYQEFMQDIVSEIDRESKIIEDLLTLVRMDKSASSLNISSVNMNDLMELTLKRLKPIAQKKNIELLFESFRPVVAQIDEVKMTQVISNLVENSIKYNVDEGWVHVSLNADYQYFYVRVEDSGIGIPEESINKIFERFYRVDKARSRETGGTGLGLAIVKNIVLMHHGTIKVHSEENIGTTFTMRIPLNYVDNQQ